MKPDRDGTELLEDFFNVLGYGNKCTKCHKKGIIKKVTKSLVHFHCKDCKLSWAFEMSSILDDITEIKKIDQS